MTGALRNSAALALVGVTLSVTLALAGCASGPQFVDEGATYTLDNASTAFDKADTSDVAGLSVGDADELQRKALSGLRSQGGAAADAAELITATFPSGARSVPVYVERATVDGDPALIIVEVIGPKAGTLQDQRLWVINESGDVLLSETRSIDDSK